MSYIQTAVLALALGLSTSAHAQSSSRTDVDEPLVQLNTQAPVKDQLIAVERALHGPHYSEISMADKSAVSAAINRIRTRLGDSDTVEALTPQAQTDIYNDQSVVNTILTNAHADSRMVCRRERPTGSNRPERVCLTVAQRRQMREDSTEGLREFQSKNR